MLPTGTWLPVYSDPCCFCSAVLSSARAAMQALTSVNKARLFGPRLGKRRLARIIRRELYARDQQCAFTHMLEAVAVRNIEAITFHRPHAPMFAALAFSAARTRGLLVRIA